MSRKILVIDDDPVHLGHIERILIQLGYQALCVTSGEEGLERLTDPSNAGIEAVILDLIMPDLDGMAVLTRLRRADSRIPVIVLAKPSALDLAMNAIAMGAQDFAVVPVGKERLMVALASALKFSALQTLALERDIEAGLLPEGGDLDLVDPELKRLLDRAGAQKSAKDPLMIEGAAGSGRTLLARTFHKATSKQDKRLVILSAAALNQDDTAAQLDLAFSNARHGTLIIQECQDLNGLSQRRILETLKKTKQRHAPRLIFTADGALFDGVKSGAFLEELFYRITLSTLRIKPLRERPEDLLTLVQSEIRRFAALYGRHDMGLTDEAKALIIDAPWAHERRNRQFVLRTLIERSKSALLTSEDVTDCTMMLPIARRQSTAELSLVNESGLMRPLAEIERDVIEFALEKSGGRIADVAQELGIGRSTLYRKLEAHGRFVDEKNSLIIGDAA